MALERWPKKYIVLALGALLSINAIQLCRYLVNSPGKGSTLRLLLRTAITAGPHGGRIGEAERPALLSAQYVLSPLSLFMPVRVSNTN